LGKINLASPKTFDILYNHGCHANTQQLLRFHVPFLSKAGLHTKRISCGFSLPQVRCTRFGEGVMHTADNQHAAMPHALHCGTLVACCVHTQQATDVRQCNAWGIATWKSHVWCGCGRVENFLLVRIVASDFENAARKIEQKPHQTWLFHVAMPHALHCGTLVASCVHDLYAKSRAMYLRQGKIARNALCVQPA